MADTGERSPQAHSGVTSGGANCIDSDESTQGSMVQFNTAAVACIISDFDGDDIPAGATINGIKVIIRAQFSNSFAATKFSLVQVSLDGASGTFSSNIGAQNLTDAAADYNFGGDDVLWGLDWSDWTDLSDLAFKITCDQQSDSATTAVTGIYEVDVIITFTEATAVISNIPLKLKGGNLNINKGGFVTANHDTPVVTSDVAGLQVHFEINHNSDGAGTGVVRYSVGLADTVAYASGFLFRSEVTVTETDDYVTHIMPGFVPGAVTSDDTVDCFFHIEIVSGFAGYAIGGFTDEVEVGQPSTSNDRFPIKLDGGTQTNPCIVTVEDVDYND